MIKDAPQKQAMPREKVASVNLSPILEKETGIVLNGKPEAYLQLQQRVNHDFQELLEKVEHNPQIVASHESAEALAARLHAIGEELGKKATFKGEVKKGFGRRALEKALSVVSYPLRNPGKTLLIALAIAAIAAGGVAAAAFFAGSFEKVLAAIGYEKLFGPGTAAAASETLSKVFHGKAPFGNVLPNNPMAEGKMY